MQWTTACPDWEERVLTRRSLIPCSPLYPDEAEAALQVFRQLRVVDVSGKPTMGEVCRPWILDYVAAIFGSYDPKAGRRQIQESFMLISKKNGKSTTAAGIMLTALMLNWRDSCEYLILAPTIEIANNSFFPARDMVREDEELSDQLHVQDHLRTITHRTTKATLKVVAADSDTVGGKKAAGILIDELWLFGRMPNAENMFREATGGLASRPEGFVITLSTQSDAPPAGIFAQKLKYARQVRDGKVKDDRFLPVIYEFPQRLLDEKAERDPANFYVTNPNLGVSVDEEFLRRQLTIAEDAGEDSLRGFLAKHLNVQIGLALQAERWAGADFWEAALDPTLTLDTLIERSEVITVGIDGGGLDDMLGLCVLGREKGTGAWLHWAHAWIHPIVLDRHKQEATRFQDLQRAGDLSIVEEVGRDIRELGDVIERIEASELLDRIGVDQSGIGDIPQEIKDRGIDMERIVGISQGWRLMSSIQTTERRLADRTETRGLSHCGQPLMAWCVGNAKVEARGNAVMITKQSAGRAKIDPLMATFDAVALMALNPQPRAKRYQMFFVGSNA